MSTEVDEDMPVSIQTWILSAVAVVTIPLYVRIIYILLRDRRNQRFKTHFYTITISQGFIDIIGFFCYFTAYNMRGIDELKPFYFSMNHTIFVQWSYMQTYLFQYARIIGVMLISIQRCSTVSYPNSRFSEYFVRFPGWGFFAIQWGLPIPLCLNMFLVPMYFDNQDKMNHVIAKDVLEWHYLKSALIPLLAIVVCCFSYGSIISTFRRNTIRNSRSGKEMQLCLQVVGLLVALLIICVHFCLQFIFNHLDMEQAVFTMRSFLPLWVGLLTFINPWMIIVINRDVRLKVMGCGAPTPTNTNQRSMLQPSTNATIQPNVQNRW